MVSKKAPQIQLAGAVLANPPPCVTGDLRFWATKEKMGLKFFFFFLGGPAGVSFLSLFQFLIIDFDLAVTPNLKMKARRISLLSAAKRARARAARRVLVAAEVKVGARRKRAEAKRKKAKARRERKKVKRRSTTSTNIRKKRGMIRRNTITKRKNQRKKRKNTAIMA